MFQLNPETRIRKKPAILSVLWNAMEIPLEEINLKLDSFFVYHGIFSHKKM